MSFLSMRLSSTARTWNCASAAITYIILSSRIRDGEEAGEVVIMQVQERGGRKGQLFEMGSHWTGGTG